MTWREIPGWYGFGETYREMVDAAPETGAVFVEVGVAFGRSVAHLSRMLIDSGKRAKLWAVDPWFDDWWCMPSQYPLHIERPSWGGEHAQFGRDLGGPFNAFVQCMLTHAPEELERINVLRCTSAKAALIVGPTNYVMIDGNHDYEAVAQDIALWRPHMLPGGILAGDDWSEEFPGVQRAVREAFGSGFETRGTTWLVRT